MKMFLLYLNGQLTKTILNITLNQLLCRLGFVLFIVFAAEWAEVGKAFIGVPSFAVMNPTGGAIFTLVFKPKINLKKKPGE